MYLEENPIYILLAKLWKNAVAKLKLAQPNEYSTITVRYVKLIFFPTCLSNDYDSALHKFEDSLTEALANIEERIKQKNFRNSGDTAEMRSKDILLALQMF